MPKRNRPFDTKSMLATSFASVIGSRSTTRQMPVPRRSVVVIDAAAASATNGSRRCEYSIGSSPPGGGGGGRAAGGGGGFRGKRGGDVGVFREEQRLEAVILYGAREFGRGDAVVGGEHRDAVFHDASCLALS